MARKNSGWWDDFFPTFRPVFGIIPQRKNNAEAKYIIGKLGLRPSKKFLDCPCGIGRIAIPLAKAGIRVTGVDFMQSYLDELVARAKRFKFKIDTVCCDMRRITFENQFDAAGNLWTSLGYFEKEADNLLVIKKAYRALKPGGKFMLHLINRDWVIANYQRRDWFEITSPRGKNLGKVVEDQLFDYRTSTSRGAWCFVMNGQEKPFTVNIRLYSFHELVRMFETVGFTDIEGFGSTKNTPISHAARMMFVIGAKPKKR